MKNSNVWVALVILAVVGLLLANIDGWQVEDDEGTALYAAWRFAEGEQPYSDFVTTNPPLFLWVGRTAIRLFGRNLLFLRALSALSILGGVSALALAIRSVWGGQVALLAWSLTLLSPQVYQLARVFRADSCMLALIFLALALMVADLARPRRWLLAAAGVVFGLAMLIKVLAVMPFFGALLWMAVRAARSRRWRAGALDGLVLGLTASALVVVGYGLTERWSAGALTMILGAQREGAESPAVLMRIAKGFVGWGIFIVNNWLLLFALPALWLVARRWRQNGREVFWAAQVLGSFPLFLISGPPYPRYLAYAVPSLLVVFVVWLKMNDELRLPEVWQPTFALLALLLPLALALPQRRLLLSYETDTKALSAWVSENTSVDAVVVSDYAALNFHAGRRSIPVQAGIGMGWALTGLVTGEMLIEQMEEANAVMLLLHVPGGMQEPSHLSNLRDYDRFYHYLETNFEPLMQWDRAGQLIEVWQRL